MTSTNSNRLPKTQAAATGRGSALARYQDLIVGRRSVLALTYFEFCTSLSWMPGGLGMAMRSLFWPRLFGGCGLKVYFGTNITLMHPHRIFIGDRTVVSSGCILDGRSSGEERVIEIGDDVVLSHGAAVSCKDGRVSIGSRTGIGPYTVIQSAEGNAVAIGDDAILGSGCYVTGGGNYNVDRLDIPISRQGLRKTGGTSIGAGVWLGARATVVGGVAIGEHSIVGAGAVVTQSLPKFSVSVGVPARMIRKRDD